MNNMVLSSVKIDLIISIDNNITHLLDAVVKKIKGCPIFYITIYVKTNTTLLLTHRVHFRMH